MRVRLTSLVRLTATLLCLGGPARVGASIERLDPLLDEVLAPDAKIERLADGFAWVEGPVWDSAAGSLLFSDIPRNSVLRWQEGTGARLLLRPSGWSGPGTFAGPEPGSNGLALDGSGRLVLCQHGDRRLARLERDGSFTVLADRYRGRRLNSPNDVVVTRAGDLLFTDPPFGLARGFEDPARELSFSGVYRLSAGALTLLIDDLDGPNGLAFSPDERTLYVTNAREKRPVLQAYELDRDGRVRGRRVLWDATPWLVRGKGLPDGVKTDRAGRLFVAGPGGLYVLGRDGALLGRVDLGAATANCAWGEDGATLFVTADTALYRLRTRTRGNW